MKKHEQVLVRHLHQLFIDLAVDDELDTNVNAWDMEGIYERAKKAAMDDREFIAAYRFDKASEWLGTEFDEDDIWLALTLLDAVPHEHRYDTLDMIDGVYPCEAAGNMTVETFLDTIDPKYNF